MYEFNVIIFNTLHGFLYIFIIETFLNQNSHELLMQATCFPEPVGNFRCVMEFYLGAQKYVHSICMKMHTYVFTNTCICICLGTYIHKIIFFSFPPTSEKTHMQKRPVSIT